LKNILKGECEVRKKHGKERIEEKEVRIGRKEDRKRNDIKSVKELRERE
jgi:hypothetical protein